MASTGLLAVSALCVVAATIAVAAWSGHAEWAPMGERGGMHGRTMGHDSSAMASHHAAMHGDGAPCTNCTTPSQGRMPRVAMQDSRFDPVVLRVTPGTTVEWVNADSYAHTVTSDDGLFDSGSIPPGKAWEYTFREAGTYSYHCTPHSASGEEGYEGMTGTVVVEETAPEGG